eukprot:44271_1
MLWILCSLAHLVMYGVKASECTGPSQMATMATDICVYGNDKLFIAEGAPFKFFTYNSITKTKVYFTYNSILKTNIYLYGCIQYDLNNNKHYYWKISDDYQLCTAWSSCYVGDESLGPNYSFDINDCLGKFTITNNWRTYDGIVKVWNDDDDMSLSICNAICYACDVYPEINTTISKSIESKITASTAWNGDVYFDFSIYEEDCIDPRISFDYQVIDHDQTYENIQIYDDNNTLIATCGGGQACGTFDSCLIDYDIDDIIPMDETYSIMIHQTANVNNLCGDYILNAVLTLTCITDNINTSIVYETLQNQCGKGEDISTTWFTPTETIKVKKNKKNSTWSIVGGVAIVIGVITVMIAAWCLYQYICHKVSTSMSHFADKQEQKFKEQCVQQMAQSVHQAPVETQQRIMTAYTKAFDTIVQKQ